MSHFNSFFDAYQLYAEGNEASPKFHEWGAIGAVSAMISRRIWFDQAYFKIYPNMYVVFVGEPGDKKTTAMNLARGIVQKAGVPCAAPSITKEAMTQLMGSKNEKSPHLTKFSLETAEGKIIVDVAHMSMFASEIVTMLNAGGNAMGMVEFLTDIYDREMFEVVTKNKGTDLIVGPYITIMACMTPEQTGNMLKQNIISGGFSRRCVFVYGRSKAEGVPFPELTKDQKAAELFLMQCYDKLIKIKGEFIMSPDARDFFASWYQVKHKKLLGPGSPAEKNWLRSKDMMAIKVAMLLCVCDFKEDRVITLEYLQRSISMLDSVEPDLNRIFAGAGRNIASELAHKILQRIKDSPQKALPQKKLLAEMFSEGTYQELTEAFNYLKETGQVVIKTNPSQSHIQLLSIP